MTHPSPEAIKAATRRLVKLCGGQEACALLGTHAKNRHQYFSEAGSVAHPDTFLRLDVLAALEADCGEPVVSSLLAEATGHRMVPLPAIEAQRDALWRISAEAMKETADVFTRLGGFLADGVLTSAEGAHLTREIDEAIVKLLALKHCADAAPKAGESR